MRNVLSCLGALLGCAVALPAQAGEPIGWDDIDTFGDFFTSVPANYNGWTWSGDVNGGGRWYVDLLDAINGGWAGTLETISGPNVAFNGFGDDDTWVILDDDYFLKSAYITRWPNIDALGSPAVRVTGYDDGELVYDSTFNTINDEWSFVDFGSPVVDEIHFSRTTPDVSWWLMDDLTLNVVPAPGALALLGVAAAIGVRRRRQRLRLSLRL